MRIHFKDGTEREADVLDYWPMGDFTKDVMVLMTDTASKFEDWYLPDPKIISIDILTKSDTPNHGGHPEVGFSTIPLDEDGDA